MPEFREEVSVDKPMVAIVKGYDWLTNDNVYWLYTWFPGQDKPVKEPSCYPCDVYGYYLAEREIALYFGSFHQYVTMQQLEAAVAADKERRAGGE